MRPRLPGQPFASARRSRACRSLCAGPAAPQEPFRQGSSHCLGIAHSQRWNRRRTTAASYIEVACESSVSQHRAESPSTLVARLLAAMAFVPCTPPGQPPADGPGPLIMHFNGRPVVNIVCPRCVQHIVVFVPTVPADTAGVANTDSSSGFGPILPSGSIVASGPMLAMDAGSLQPPGSTTPPSTLTAPAAASPGPPSPSTPLATAPGGPSGGGPGGSGSSQGPSVSGADSCEPGSPAKKKRRSGD